MAHIHKNANVGWMCWPKFDSSFIFGSLLDDKKGGYFSIQPAGSDREIDSTKQSYMTNTNILCTKFEIKGERAGGFCVIDFAPRFVQHERRFSPLMLIRKIEPIGGTAPRVVVRCHPTYDYGETKFHVNIGSNHIKYTGFDYTIRLHVANMPLNYIVSEREFVLNETVYLVLSWEDTVNSPVTDMCENFLRKTKIYWEEWIRRSVLPDLWQEEVIRSALTLKLHQYYDTGAIIASGTTSLPESPGSGRNWDYRYCWLRDSYYTLNAFNHLGHFEELERFSMYIQNVAMQEDSGYQPVYSILGDAKLEEKELDLMGYQNNTPVRIGNLAYTHVQNDLYGQILASLLPFYIDKRLLYRKKKISIELVYNLLGNIKKRMDEPDSGLWEYRNTSQKHCYTFLFHWAGASAAEKIGLNLDDKHLIRLSRLLKRKAASRIERCHDESLKAYTEAIGSKNMDASLLQLITMNYLPPMSEKSNSHLALLEQKLRASDGLFYRYTHTDDFGKPEVTFLICAFWYVDALAHVGRLDEAIMYFEKLLNFGNHLGLYSEDMNPKTGSQWGNFPQTYSHVGLINSAFRIWHRLDKPNFC